MDSKYIVYIHINKINLKVYIGQTCQKPNKRWRNGQGYINQNTYFANAIKKYGWDNFEHIILEENLTKSQADFYEQMYIKTYKSTDRDKGYNLTYGGGGMLASEETRKKMSQNHANVSGINAPMYGKNIKDFMTEEAYAEWLRKIREYFKAHRRGNNKGAIKVYCPELDKSYDCLTDAAEDCNTSVGDISGCINGYNVSAGYDKSTGLFLHWCKFEDKNTFIPPQQEQSTHMGKYSARSKQIYCPELDEMFYGTGEIKRKYKFNAAHIIDCCNNKRVSCGKHPETKKALHWCYAENADSFQIPDEACSRHLGKYHYGARAVYCYELDEVFDTATEASKKYGFSKQHIGSVCRGERNTTGKHPISGEKLHWAFLSDINTSDVS